MEYYIPGIYYNEWAYIPYMGGQDLEVQNKYQLVALLTWTF